jgi:Fe-S-cluster-containing hydrogenase component 2
MVYTSSKACIYSKGKHGMIHMVQKNETPKSQLERATNPKFPPQAHKCSLVERLCKDVCKLILVRDMTNTIVPFSTLSLKK